MYATNRWTDERQQCLVTTDPSHTWIYMTIQFNSMYMFQTTRIHISSNSDRKMTEYTQERQTEHTNVWEKSICNISKQTTRSLSHNFHWALKTYRKLNIAVSKLGIIKLS